MQNTQAVLAGVVILAGGKSSRMGRDKATLLLPSGEQLIDYHIRQARRLNVPIIVASNRRELVMAAAVSAPMAAQISIISDYQPSTLTDNAGTEGPLAGIAAALDMLANGHKDKQHTPAWLLVLSCDSLVTAPMLWQQLSTQMHQTSIAAPDINCAFGTHKASSQTPPDTVNNTVICLTDDTHMHPLLGLYHLSLASDLKAYLDSGERRVMAFIKPKVQTVRYPQAWQPLTNFNTPSEFQRACAVKV